MRKNNLILLGVVILLGTIACEDPKNTSDGDSGGQSYTQAERLKALKEDKKSFYDAKPFLEGDDFRNNFTKRDLEPALKGLFAEYNIRQREDSSATIFTDLGMIFRDPNRQHWFEGDTANETDTISDPSFMSAINQIKDFVGGGQEFNEWRNQLMSARDWQSPGTRNAIKQRVVNLSIRLGGLVGDDGEMAEALRTAVKDKIVERSEKCPDANVFALDEIELSLRLISAGNDLKSLVSLGIANWKMQMTGHDLLENPAGHESLEGALFLQTALGSAMELTTLNREMLYAGLGKNYLKFTLYKSMEEYFKAATPERLAYSLANWKVAELRPFEDYVREKYKTAYNNETLDESKKAYKDYLDATYDGDLELQARLVPAYEKFLLAEATEALKSLGYLKSSPDYPMPTSWF